MRSRRIVRPSELKNGHHPEEDGTINVAVKTCRNCSHVFVEGYHGSLGVQFWLSALTFVGGIAYWALRGRGNRCPVCKKKVFIVRQGIVIVDEPNERMDSSVDHSSRQGATHELCPSCGRKIIHDSAYCEGCGRKLA